MKFDKSNKKKLFIESLNSEDFTKNPLEDFNVNTLILSEIDLNLKNTKILCELLTKLKNLDTLRLSNCQITPKKLGILLDSIKEKSNITTLGLSCFTITPEHIPIIVEDRENFNLKSLDLSGNNLGVNEIISLLKDIKNSKITNLNISDNINEPNSEWITALKEHGKKLESLDISWNSIEGEEPVNILSSLLEQSNLRYLNISSNGITNTSMLTLLKGANHSQSNLKGLDVSHNMLVFDKNMSVLKALRSPELTYLNIKDNKITTDAIECMPNYLKETCLTKIKGCCSSEIQDILQQNHTKIINRKKSIVISLSQSLKFHGISSDVAGHILSYIDGIGFSNSSTYLHSNSSTYLQLPAKKSKSALKMTGQNSPRFFRSYGTHGLSMEVYKESEPFSRENYAVLFQKKFNSNVKISIDKFEKSLYDSPKRKSVYNLIMLEFIDKLKNLFNKKKYSEIFILIDNELDSVKGRKGFQKWKYFLSTIKHDLRSIYNKQNGFAAENFRLC